MAQFDQGFGFIQPEEGLMSSSVSLPLSRLTGAASCGQEINYELTPTADQAKCQLIN
jgi:hypothetical protein